MEVKVRLEKVQKALESSVQNLDLMGRLLVELDLLQRRAQDVNLDKIEDKVKKLMPELGFLPEDTNRLVSSFSGGWQMRISLGKILLQATEECTAVLELDHEHTSALMLWAQTLVTLKDYQFALFDVNRLMEINLDS